MSADQIVYIIGILSTGAVFYACGYWAGKSMWRKTGYEEGYLEAIRRISVSDKNNFQTKLRKTKKKGK